MEVITQLTKCKCKKPEFSSLQSSFLLTGNGNYLTNGNGIEMEIIPEMVIRIKWKLHGFEWK